MKAALGGEPVLAVQRGECTTWDGERQVGAHAAQVVVLDTRPVDRSRRHAFKREMIALAEAVCRAMQVESTVVELQRHGLTKGTMGVVP